MFKASALTSKANVADTRRHMEMEYHCVGQSSSALVNHYTNTTSRNSDASTTTTTWKAESPALGFSKLFQGDVYDDELNELHDLFLPSNSAPFLSSHVVFAGASLDQASNVSSSGIFSEPASFVTSQGSLMPPLSMTTKGEETSNKNTGLSPNTQKPQVSVDFKNWSKNPEPNASLSLHPPPAKRRNMRNDKQVSPPTTGKPQMFGKAVSLSASPAPIISARVSPTNSQTTAMLATSSVAPGPGCYILPSLAPTMNQGWNQAAAAPSIPGTAVRRISNPGTVYHDVAPAPTPKPIVPRPTSSYGMVATGNSPPPAPLAPRISGGAPTLKPATAQYRQPTTCNWEYLNMQPNSAGESLCLPPSAIASEAGHDVIHYNHDAFALPTPTTSITSSSSTPKGTLITGQNTVQPSPHQRGQRGGRRRDPNMSREQTEKEHRERNKRHARNTRLRNKAFVEAIKEELNNLVDQRDAASRQANEKASNMLQSRQTRFEAMETFLRLRGQIPLGKQSRNGASAAFWTGILDEQVTLSRQSHKFYPDSAREMAVTGISAVMEDPNEAHLLIKALHDANNSFSHHPAIGVVYECDRSSLVMDGCTCILQWKGTTEGAVTQLGVQSELALSGSLRVRFDEKSNKMAAIKLFFDTGASRQNLSR